MQLTGFGAQNILVNGNPSTSYFVKMYKRSTNFAMEHFQLQPSFITDTSLPTVGKKTFQFKVSRYADLLHDCYLCVNIPDIYSGLHIVNSSTGEAVPYEFQWVRNLGYNMIEELSVTFNGTSVCNMTGEWMKVKSYLKDDVAQREKLDQMTGNTPDLYDPANADGRFNQYPNSITTTLNPTPAPSIRGRQLVIPLSFWFCEEIGQSLPLIALAQSEIFITITLTNIYNLFTCIDVNPTSPTYGQRIVGNPGNDQLSTISTFLGPSDPAGNPLNISLFNWNLNPYIEANYVFLTETERAHIAAFERTYLVTETRWVYYENQYGFNDILLPMYNLCTRVVALFQRSDRALLNDWDNYTNWLDPYSPPLQLTTDIIGGTTFYVTGALPQNNMSSQDILQEGRLVFDGKDRFNTKPVSFFRSLENYKFSKGPSNRLPGVNVYSFAWNPDEISQPSGSANGSMFNRTSFLYTLLVPPATNIATPLPPVCVYKNTVFDNNPVPVSPAILNTPNVNPGDVVTIYPKQTTTPIQFGGYNSVVYIESYNFLKVTNGQANLVFTT